MIEAVATNAAKASLKEKKKKNQRPIFADTLLWAAISIFSCILPDLQRWDLFQPSFLYHKEWYV